MPQPNVVLLYVQSPEASAAFYRRLLERPPIEASPTFAMFALDSGVKLGLWAAPTVVPPATPPGGQELAFAVDGDAAVRAVHASWVEQGIPVLQPPTEMDFGHTFVAVDPDGHRLRVYAPNGG